MNNFLRIDDEFMNCQRS